MEKKVNNILSMSLLGVKGQPFTQGRRGSFRWRTALAMLAVATFVATSWAATEETVLHRFNPNGGDGAFPQTTLVADGAGNRYGTTFQGGPYGAGTVFELTPTQGGGWTERVLHNFNLSTADGSSPYAGLIIDAQGNLYGTTQSGGTYYGGTVFELTPKGGGNWTEKILHSFGSNGADGAGPEAGLIMDSAGNLYGTTSYGGTFFSGTVFELTRRPPRGEWTERVLYSFRYNYNGTDGASPYGGLVLDTAGNLYGTTVQGGTNDRGTVFELQASGGRWSEKILHNFGSGSDGWGPWGDWLFRAVTFTGRLHMAAAEAWVPCSN